jgi:hypothetical protein
MARGDAGDDTPDDACDGAPLALDTLQRDILIAQVDAFLGATSDPQARKTYADLKSAIELQEVPAALQARLGAIVEVALSSGRVRKLFGPGAEIALNTLFTKTPRGREIAQSVTAVNEAMKQLAGASIEHIAATVRRPGIYTLTISTAQCQIVLRFEPGGVAVDSLEVDFAK